MSVFFVSKGCVLYVSSNYLSCINKQTNQKNYFQQGKSNLFSTPKSDLHLISPYHIILESNNKVTRMVEMITLTNATGTIIREVICSN